jgi:hypothetical protein
MRRRPGDPGVGNDWVNGYEVIEDGEESFLWRAPLEAGEAFVDVSGRREGMRWRVSARRSGGRSETVALVTTRDEAASAAEEWTAEHPGGRGYAGRGRGGSGGGLLGGLGL